MGSIKKSDRIRASMVCGASVCCVQGVHAWHRVHRVQRGEGSMGSRGVAGEEQNGWSREGRSWVDQETT